MESYPYNKRYRVYKNDTAVIEVPINDFKAQKLEPGLISELQFSLPLDEGMFYEYNNKIKAMEKAKAGALAHINSLIQEAVQAIDRLKKYREEHFEDLNSTLLDRNIRDLEKELGIK